MTTITEHTESYRCFDTEALLLEQRDLTLRMEAFDRVLKDDRIRTDDDIAFINGLDRRLIAVKRVLKERGH